MTNPQIIMIVLLALSGSINFIKNGETYTKNAFHTIFISAPLVATVLWFGGFWEVVGAPQIITIIIMTMNCVFALSNHGKTETYRALAVVVDLPLIIGLYWWGGFWA